MSDDLHRGIYDCSIELVEIVTKYLRQHQGERVRKAQILHATRLSWGELERAITALSFVDPRLCEDDQGNLTYLADRS